LEIEKKGLGKYRVQINNIKFMSEFKDYKSLDVWQKSRDLAKMVYLITNNFPKTEIFGLTSQMRKSVISIPSNIAEGIGRNHVNETIHFLGISKGSLFELETQVYISKDLDFINEDNFQKLFQVIEDCKKLLNGFISYYKQKSTN
jgi:four helix bundle protein